MIELGAEGPQVRVWQRIVGVPWKQVDGNFGPKTKTAVAVWQGARGVEPDGVIGPLTRAALKPADLIKPHEGLRLWAYDDHDGKMLSLDGARVWRRPDGAACMGTATIGWGSTEPCRRGVQTCTREEADRWFYDDLNQERLPLVKRYLTNDMAQICAGASFCYNAGTGAFKSLAKQGFSEAVWRAYDKVTDKRTGQKVLDPNLDRRREEEYALYSDA